jgi:hypothetical protein
MTMMNRQTGERMCSQVWTGRDYSERTSPDLITTVPTADEAAALVIGAEA